VDQVEVEEEKGKAVERRRRNPSQRPISRWERRINQVEVEVWVQAARRRKEVHSHHQVEEQQAPHQAPTHFNHYQEVNNE
jgi:hypothetical protein